MEHPLRSAVYTKQIKELIDQYKIKLIGSSYGADMWNKDKKNRYMKMLILYLQTWLL